MIRYKPIEINKLSFIFCRYSMAIIIWLAFIFHVKALIWISAVIFLLSVVLKIKRAPMIKLADFTLGKIWKTQPILVNEYAMSFAHLVGFYISIICICLVSFSSNENIWYVVGLFGLLKSVSALGFCPAAKLYECLLNGSCCVNHKVKQ
jgi:hypothetical protein